MTLMPPGVPHRQARVDKVQGLIWESTQSQANVFFPPSLPVLCGRPAGKRNFRPTQSFV
ncbi:hypothetical protein BDZ91DRAFT_171854 [Kalaharituber pfeilii]|nr:hypothetical protein BDZ91DRAFT_171854 [Kalaharituber pfeilii]